MVKPFSQAHIQRMLGGKRMRNRAFGRKSHGVRRHDGVHHFGSHIRRLVSHVQRMREKRRPQEEIPDVVSFYAAFSTMPYAGNDVASRNAREKELLGEEVAAQYVMDESLSNKDMAVWVNESKHEVVTSFKGSNELADIGTDMDIILGIQNHSPRFKRSIEDYGKVVEKYPDMQHVLASHSLGGKINMAVYDHYANDDLKLVAHNYNPGSGPMASLEGLHAKMTGESREHMHSHFIVGDVLSTFGTGDPSHNVHFYAPVKGSFNPHSTEQFIAPRGGDDGGIVEEPATTEV